MSEGIAVRILDREFMIGCKPEERESLQAAAQLLEARMRGIRGDNRMAAFDRIAVIAALNLAAEVHSFRRELEGRDTDLTRGLADLNRKVDALLGQVPR
ncbi:cell division protein ZapA [Silanimonas sp.]|uniref:cell division protein ZapA n=1 Tax=Silanimonas sp. TaxID=1929290 RepID=UPI001BC44440|nr:cell division protein ZapA [Silanimonas sp.]MBS3895828.1 cell division protein ZapA [Silanimonas sp.]